MSESCQSVRRHAAPAPAVRVLVAGDDRRWLADVFARLEADGFQPDAAPDGRGALALARSGDHDVLVIDRARPGGDGLVLLRRLRAEGTSLPVLVSLADDRLEARLAAFDAGADDCVGRPVATAELAARLRALSRRRCPSPVLQVADLRFDTQTGEITRGARRLRPFRGGRAVLEALLRASPAIVPRHRLEDVLWGDAPPGRDRLRTHVYELRRQVDAAGEPRLLHTVPGVGYRLASVAG